MNSSLLTGRAVNPALGHDLKLASTDLSPPKLNQESFSLKQMLASGFTGEERAQLDSVLAQQSGLDPVNPAERRKYWIEERGQAMDPFDRHTFWGKQGYQLLVGKPSDLFDDLPVPYAQISLDYDNGDPGVTSLSLLMKPLDETLAVSVPVPVYLGIYDRMQISIDDRAKEMAEYQAVAGVAAHFSRNGALHYISQSDRESHRILKIGANQLELGV